MSASSTRSRRKSRAAALFGSVALHIALFTAMVITLRLPVQPADTPSMQVELYASLFDLRQPRPRVQPKADSARERVETPSPLPAPSPEMLRQQGPTNRPIPRGPITRGPMAEVQPFYRDHIPGCGREDLALMDAAERDKCEKQISAQAVIDNGKMQASDRFATPILRLDPDRRAEFDRAVGRRRARQAQNDPMKPCDGPTVGLGSACLNHDKPE